MWRPWNDATSKSESESKSVNVDNRANIASIVSTILDSPLFSCYATMTQQTRV